MIDAKLDMQVGQKVYICDNRRYLAGEVVKVTPTGMVDVKYGVDATLRFRRDGRALGDNYYRARMLDTEMPFEARAEYVRNSNALDAAALAINKIEVKPISFWNGRQADKSDLIEELDRIQGLVDTAHELLSQCK